MVAVAVCQRSRIGLISHGQLLSTLDQLGADQTGDLRNHHGLWVDRSNMVLRNAKVHAGAVPADPAGAVPA